MIDEDQSGRLKEKPFPLRLMIVTLILWILICAAQWEIIHVLTPFLMFPLQVICFVIAAVIFTICTARTVLQWKRESFSRSICIRIIVVALFVFSLFLPLDDIYEQARFSVLATRFDASAQEIIAAETSARTISLPSEYRCLSRGGGEAIVFGEGQKKVVLFFSYRGILDNYSVYAYAPNDQAYSNLLRYENWIQVTSVRDGWYFCASA